jgi:hypothetical protein
MELCHKFSALSYPACEKNEQGVRNICLDPLVSNNQLRYRHCVGLYVFVISFYVTEKKKKPPWSANELYRPSDRRLSAKWLPSFTDRGCQRGQGDGALRPCSRFYRQEPLLFYQVAPQLYSRGWVDPVPDLLHFSGSAGNRTWASGSVAKNSDH